MKKTDDSHLLESVIRITEQRDQHSLEVCLVRTLRELISAREIVLYEYTEERGARRLKRITDPQPASGDSNDATHARYPLGEDDPDLVSCLASRQTIISTPTDGNGFRQIHPVMGKDDVVGFLLVETDNMLDRDQDLISSFLRIYNS